jgi:hypothetical protein
MYFPIHELPVLKLIPNRIQHSSVAYISRQVFPHQMEDAEFRMKLLEAFPKFNLFLIYSWMQLCYCRYIRSVGRHWTACPAVHTSYMLDLKKPQTSRPAVRNLTWTVFGPDCTHFEQVMKYQNTYPLKLICNSLRIPNQSLITITFSKITPCIAISILNSIEGRFMYVLVAIKI